MACNRRMSDSKTLKYIFEFVLNQQDTELPSDDVYI